MCEGGIRTQVTFPTCWDGVSLDSPDHQSHVAYAEIPYEPYFEPKATFPYTPEQQRGKCPEGYPVMLPQVMYEVMFDTTPFNDKELWGEEERSLLCSAWAMRESWYARKNVFMLTRVLGLATVITETTCSDGRAIHCRGR
jgi:hypothetical protein